MRECREEEERREGGGRPFCNPRVMGVRLAAGIFTRQKHLYIAGHGGEVCWYSGLLFFFFKPSIIDPPTGKRFSEGPKTITEKREEDQQKESFSAAAQNKRKNSQLEVTESCVCHYGSSNSVFRQNTASGI